MRPPLQVAVPRAMVERKPRYGTPCNRCGACCYATLCPLGMKVFRREIGPCPALTMNGGESSCRLVVEPRLYSPRAVERAGSDEAAGKAASFLMGAGIGCDARINGEPKDDEVARRFRIWDHKNAGSIRRAKKIWEM